MHTLPPSPHGPDCPEMAPGMPRPQPSLAVGQLGGVSSLEHPLSLISMYPQQMTFSCAPQFENVLPKLWALWEKTQRDSGWQRCQVSYQDPSLPSLKILNIRPIVS